jgi:hypothetical protein
MKGNGKMEDSMERGKLKQRERSLKKGSGRMVAE